METAYKNHWIIINEDKPDTFSVTVREPITSARMAFAWFACLEEAIDWAQDKIDLIVNPSEPLEKGYLLVIQWGSGKETSERFEHIEERMKREDEAMGAGAHSIAIYLWKRGVMELIGSRSFAL